MIQPRERQRFLAKALANALIVEHARGEDLYLDATLQALIARAIDHAHAARPQHFEEAVTAGESLSDEVLGHGVNPKSAIGLDGRNRSPGRMKTAGDDERRNSDSYNRLSPMATAAKD